MNANQKKQITQIITETDDMTIATVRPDGFPQATTVSYVSDGMTIYFGTSDDSQKAKNIAANNKISLTINRPYDSWDSICGISMGGFAHRVSDPDELTRVGQLMLEKFPQIAELEGLMPGEAALFRIEPVAISLLDYTKGFGHTENVTP
ncbi:pyridoxamine 5'-phosphate oxidase family protein [Aestuariivita boseongensis]|uniref:pyridoxamine 5'-phosphate oxidase family protein n=1 Tax=Aestuariivita boseongensis TaxID=1470562 RepID=UPI000682E335|nr:pyridoxamine 5'-phosphate oxidase family protein [Aestuariivita boseongensis]